LEQPTDIVGHKTFSDGAGGFRHEPLTRDEADSMWAAALAAKAKREADMPDVETALRALTDAHTRLKELGWREAQYGKQDGVMVDLIEPGCSSVLHGYWRNHGKDWTSGGCFWIPAEGDEWPSHPILFRPSTGDKTP
jgi:hypothetical protein